MFVFDLVTLVHIFPKLKWEHTVSVTDLVLKVMKNEHGTHAGSTWYKFVYQIAKHFFLQHILKYDKKLFESIISGDNDVRYEKGLSINNA